MPPVPAKTALSERNEQILLLAKGEMITPEIVLRRFLPDGSIEAARSAIRRLCGEDENPCYLAAEPLDGRRVYYRLTPLAAKILGISPKYAVPLKKLGRVRHYALSWFIHAARPGCRKLIDSAEVIELLGLRGHRLPRHPFFLDVTTGQEKLGMIFIDHNAHLRRIVQKTVRPLARFLRHGWFDELIFSGHFLLAVLTFSGRRQRAITMQLQLALKRLLGSALRANRSDPSGPLCVQVHLIPGMDAVIATPNHEEREHE